jgi:hypothetical protein
VIKIQFIVFWVVTLCSEVAGYQHSGGPGSAVSEITDLLTTI